MESPGGLARRGLHALAAPAALFALLLLVPGAGMAQGTPGEPERYSEEAIERFARMHLEIAEVRDDLHQDLARYPEAGRRQEARDRAEERLAEIFERYQVRAEEYERFIVRTALDQELRDAFEEILKRIEEEEPHAPL